jgi:rhamnosyltransferase
MFFAAKAIRNGYRVAYAAEALVYHSHNFSLKEQYQRNYIQGYEIERHRPLLGEVNQESEGMKLVQFVSSGLLKKGQFVSFVHFGLDCCARLLGSKGGKKKYLSETEQAR